MLEPVSNLTGSQASPNGDSPVQNDLDKNAFLKLLITQINHQDPLSPLQNEAFVAQLAQFSSLEQMQNINKNLEESINADFLLNKAMNNSLVTTLIGKKVLASTNTINLKGQSDIDLGFQLSAQAKNVKVKIYDGGGKLVRTLDLGPQAAGEHAITWDGKDQEGNDLSEGRYTFEVQATAGEGQPAVKASPFIEGTITGVRYEDGVAYLLIGNMELSLGDVQKIMQG